MSSSWLQLALAVVMAASTIPLAGALVLRTHGAETTSTRALSVLVLWCALHIAVAMVLGMVGLLRFWPLVLVDLVLAGAGVMLWRRQSPRKLLDFSHLGLVERLLLAIAGWIAAAEAWRLATTPITNFDSLRYHLTHMAEWYQQGELVLMPQLGPPSRYPFSWELFGMLSFYPLGEDLAVALVNLVAWGIMGLGCYAVARHATAGRSQSLAAAVTLLLIPEFLNRLNGAQVDVAVAAFVVALVHFSVLLSRRVTPFRFVLVCVCAGMLIGIKVTGLSFVVMVAAVTLLLVALRCWRASVRHRLLEDLRALWPRPLVIGLGAVLLLCSFWYVRNWVDLGNPLGELRVEVAGVELFPGELELSELRESSLGNMFVFRNPKHRTTYRNALARHMGVPLLVLGAEALLLVVGVLIWPLRKGRGGFTLDHLVIVALMVGLAVHYWYTPATATTGFHGGQITGWVGNALRFAFPAVALLGCAAATGLAIVRFPGFLLVPLVGWLAWMVGRELYTTRSLLVSVMVVSMVALLAWGSRWRHRIPYGNPGYGIVVSLIILIILGRIGAAASATRHDERARTYGDGYVVLEDRAEAGSVVGYVSSTAPYLLYGSRLDRRVLALPSKGDTSESWMAMVREREVDFIASGPYIQKRLGWTRIPALRWMDTGPLTELFDPLHTDVPATDIAIYEVRPPAAETGDGEP